MTTLGLLPNLGMPELIILAALGLLIFGRRLPEVGRGLGRSIVEFRKGLKGVEDEVEDASNKPSLPNRDEVGRVPGTVAQSSAQPVDITQPVPLVKPAGTPGPG
jgi:sec-independent protein translocase protein TatA